MVARWLTKEPTLKFGLKIKLVLHCKFMGFFFFFKFCSFYCPINRTLIFNSAYFELSCL